MKINALSLRKYKENVRSIFANYNPLKDDITSIIHNIELRETFSLVDDINVMVPRFKNVLLSLKCPEILINLIDKDVLIYCPFSSGDLLL